jgi:hypothetical protein
MTDDDPKKPKKPVDESFGTPRPTPLLPPTADGPLPSYKPPAKSGATPTPPTPEPPPPPAVRRPPTQPPPIPSRPSHSLPPLPREPVPAAPLPPPQDRSEMVTPVGGAPIVDWNAVAPQAVSYDQPRPPPEEPLLPTSYSENDLRSAVGVAPFAESSKATRRPPEPVPFDDDDDDLDEDGVRKKGKGGRMLVGVAVFSVLLGLAIAALIFFGRSNSDRYVIACEAQQIVPQQGRTFPPWGESALTGSQWKPVPIPPEAECESLETESLDVLTASFRDRLVARAEDMLMKGEGAKVDEAAAMLDQALMLARDPRFKDARKYIQRVLGDVTYWRASAKLKEAATLLGDATKQFETAVASQPRIATDADAWAKFVKELAAKLQAGPSGVKAVAFPPTPPASERPQAPPGVALPVEPEPDAGSAKGSAAEPAPDAGIPSGGVLL